MLYNMCYIVLPNIHQCQYKNIPKFTFTYYNQYKMAKGNSYFGSSNKIYAILIFIFIPIAILTIILIPQLMGSETIEDVVEETPYKIVTKYTNLLAEGTECFKPKGQKGTILKQYRVRYHFGQESSRELVSETISSHPVDELHIVGTAHKYSGYCAIEKPGKLFRAECYGDFSPEAKAKAKEQALICNNSDRELPECHNTYYSSVWNGYKNCSQINTADL